MMMSRRSHKPRASIANQLHQTIPIRTIKQARCLNCKYLRILVSDQYRALCLMRGQPLSRKRGTPALVEYSVAHIVCDEWKLRPSTWKVYNNMNPMWHDPYLQRYTLEQIRESIVRRLKKHVNNA